MKCGVATMTGETVTRHYGRAKYVAVLTVDDGRIVSRELRAKPRSESPTGHEHGHGRAAAAAAADCDIIIAGGMGRRAAEHLHEAGVEVVLTDVRDVEEAVLRLAAGDLPHLEDRFHESEHHR